MKYYFTINRISAVPVDNQVEVEAPSYAEALEKIALSAESDDFSDVKIGEDRTRWEDGFWSEFHKTKVLDEKGKVVYTSSK